MSGPHDAPRSVARPSPLASWLAGTRIHPDEREFVLGDLEEEFQEIARWQGAYAARAWYWRQAWKAALWPPSGAAARHLPFGLFMSSLFGDLRYTLRGLRRAPAFAAAAIITLALALGANVAIFALIDRIVLQPLDVPHAADLVTFERAFTGPAGAPVWVDYTWWTNADRLRRMQTIDAAAIATRPIDPGSLGLVVDGADGRGAERLRGLFVSANYFRVLGLQLALGRDFAAAEDAPNAAPVAVVSNEFWLRHFGGAASALGRAITVNGAPALVIGVAPATFTGARMSTAPPDLYLPLQTGSRLATRGSVAFEAAVTPASISPLADFSVIARVPAGGRARTQKELESLFDSGALESRGGDHAWRVVPLVDTMLPIDARSDARWFIALLGTAVGLTLLIGCANLGGLLLARVEGRRGELAIRAAVGASRARLLQQIGVETVVLVLAGGVAALFVARSILSGFSTFVLPGGIAIASLRQETDGRVLWFAALATIAAAGLVGVAPASRAADWDLALEAKEQSLASPTFGRARVLVAAQVLVCTVLVFAAGIFARSLSNALAMDLGFDPRGLVAASLSLPKDDQLRSAEAVDALVERVRALPGVVAATPGPAPLVQGANVTRYQVVVDATASPVPEGLDEVFAAPDYFRTLRQPIVLGRDFDDRDQNGAPLVAIVPEATARRFWGRLNVLGRQIGIPTPAETREYTVVGIARDAKLDTLGDVQRPVIYAARDQYRIGVWGGQTASGVAPLVIRVAPGSTVAGKSLAQTAADAGIAMQSVTNVPEAVDRELMPQRFGRALLGLLGALALALTLVGVHGLVSCIVARSTKEVGVRMALGASSAEIVRTLMRKAVLPVSAGLAGGVVLAWFGGRFADRFMYGMRGADPTTVVVTVAAIVVGVLVAAILPARRALATDAMAVLRRG